MLEGEGEKREVDEGKHVIADPPGHGAEPRALTSNKDDCWKRHASPPPAPAPAPAPARTIFDSIRLLHRAPDALVLETEATQRCRVEHVPAVHHGIPCGHVGTLRQQPPRKHEARGLAHVVRARLEREPEKRDPPAPERAEWAMERADHATL